MKTLVVMASLLASICCFPSPQEYDQTLLQDILGAGAGDGYSNNLGGDVTEVDKTIVETGPGDCSDYAGWECVPYYQCSGNNTIITDGTGLIDIRNGFLTLDAADGKCPGFLDVCCKDPDHVPPPVTPTPYTARCGRRNIDGLGARITGFNELESQVGEWPHMCALLREEVQEVEDGYSGGDPETINHFVCGASLISDGTVLTAAHCVDKYVADGGDLTATLKIRCGEWDTQTENEPYPHQDRYVDRLFVHPEYFGGALFNDFAVLFTTDDFIMDHNVDSICLPEPQEDFEFEDFVGSTCFATGWGKDKFGKDGNYQVVLKEIDLPVVNHATCQTELRKTRLGKRFRLHNSFLCAGGEPGKDTCKGDGGSPLVCPRGDGSYVQAGIVAWGVGCGEMGTPGVYADVSKAVCWIDYIMAGRGAAQGSVVSSVLGYDQQICGSWLESKRNSQLPEQVKSQYQLWSVIWPNNVDNVNQFARQEEEDSYSVNDETNGQDPRSTEQLQAAEPYGNVTDDDSQTSSDVTKTADTYKR